MSDLDLAALIGSRICHDLISPIGAIGNGVELLLMDGANAPGPELALISDSVAAANGRIRLFRLAFGGAGQGQGMSLADLRAALAGLGAAGRWRLDLVAPDPVPRPEARVLALAHLCLEAAFPMGATVAARWRDEGWQITATGARLRWDAGLWAHVGGAAAGGDVTAPIPASVQFPLLAQALAQLGRMGQVMPADGALQLRA